MGDIGDLGDDGVGEPGDGEMVTGGGTIPAMDAKPWRHVALNALFLFFASLVGTDTGAWQGTRVATRTNAVGAFAVEALSKWVVQPLPTADRPPTGQSHGECESQQNRPARTRIQSRRRGQFQIRWHR